MQVEEKLAVMSLSGGMDSTGLLVHLLARGYSVKCIGFDYGQKHSIELERAKKNIEYLQDNENFLSYKIIDLTDLGSSLNSALTSDSIEVPTGHYEQENMKATVVPNRNAIFSSIIYSIALSLAIERQKEVKFCLGVHAGDHEIYPDCRQMFFHQLHKAFTCGNWDSELVDLYLPFINGNKTTILKGALEDCKTLGVSFDVVFANTNTSYNPDEFGRSSGTSGADVERILAFHELGLKDPVEYVDPWDIVLKNALLTEESFKQQGE